MTQSAKFRGWSSIASASVDRHVNKWGNLDLVGPVMYHGSSFKDLDMRFRS